MKKIITLLFIITMFFSITPVFATEIESSSTEEYNSPEAKEIEEKYNNLMFKLSEKLFNGEITQEDYDAKMEFYQTNKYIEMDKAEEAWLEEQYIASLPEVDYTINHKDVYDENGEKITDFTDVDINTISSKKTLTFKGILEQGTKTTPGFTIKVQVAAENLIFTDVNVLDESNDYTCEILVPNDTYIITLTSPSTGDVVIFDEHYIDASDEPTLNVYIVGATKIITSENDIISIEGGEIVETPQEKDNGFAIFQIVFGVLFGIGIIGLAIYAVKKKKELEM